METQQSQNDGPRKVVDRAHEPKISVIMPNFNKGNFIELAIKSILNQSFRDFELIIVDDASTDHSVDIAMEYELLDHRVRLIKMNKHSGLPSHVLNIGIKDARGQIVTFAGSDDLFAPGRIESLLRPFEENLEPVVVYSKPQRIDETVKEVSQSVAIDDMPSGWIYDKLLVENFITAGIIAVPKVCFEKVGQYDTALSMSEDYEMCLRLARDYRFVFVRERTYGYRIFSGNAVNRVSKLERYRCKAMILEKYLNESPHINSESMELARQTLFSFYVASRQWSKVLKMSLSSPRGAWLLVTLPFRAL